MAVLHNRGDDEAVLRAEELGVGVNPRTPGPRQLAMAYVSTRRKLGLGFRVIRDTIHQHLLEGQRLPVDYVELRDFRQGAADSVHVEQDAPVAAAGLE